MSVVNDDGDVSLLGQPPSRGAAGPPLPKSLEDLKAEDRDGAKQCTVCRQKVATYAVSVLMAKIEQHRGRADYHMTRVPVCEACGAQVVGLAKRALKQ